MVLKIAVSDQCSLFYLIFFTIKVCSKQLLKFTPSSVTKSKKPFISLAYNFIIIAMLWLYIHVVAMHTTPEWIGVKG